MQDLTPPDSVSIVIPAAKLTSLQPNVIAQMDDDQLCELHRRLHALYDEQDEELCQRLRRTHQYFRVELIQRGIDHAYLNALDGEGEAFDLSEKVQPEADTSHRDSVCLFFSIPDHLRPVLCCEDGEPPEALHMTVAFFGHINDWSDDQLAKLVRIVGEYASRSHPISGTVNGIGRFAAGPHSDAKDVVYRVVDAPELPQWRGELLECLSRCGIVPQADHGYVPHITVRYIDPKLVVELGPQDSHAIVFDTLICSIGPDEYYFMMGHDSDQPLQKVSSVEKLVVSEHPPSLFIRESDGPTYMIYGVALVPDEPDLDGDVFSAEVIRRACERFSTRPPADEKHRYENPELDVVESFIAPEGYSLAGHPIKAGSWIVGIKTDDPSVIDKVRNGTYTGLSIDGYAVVKSYIQDAHDTKIARNRRSASQ